MLKSVVKDGWAMCGKCRHKLGRLMNGGYLGDGIEIKCSSCKEINLVEGERGYDAKKREEFLDALVEIAEYWKDKNNSSYGALFSFLAMCDGCSSINDFHTININGMNTNGRELHDDFIVKGSRLK